MFRKIRLLASIALLATAIVARADDGKSFSKQMNEIKRSGKYIYAEAAAPDENQAKAACDDLLKIEITKYLAENSGPDSDTRIVKNISGYHRDYFTQIRGDLIRVFGYIAKSDIKIPEAADVVQAAPTVSQEDTVEPSVKSETPDDMTAEPETVDSVAGATQVSEPEATQEASDTEEATATTTPDSSAESTISQSQDSTAGRQASNGGLKTEGMQLARWQIEMLESVVAQSNPLEAKKLLNRYKTQHRIKRLGDNTVSNPRPADSYYLVYGSSNAPIALLAPSATDSHYDMISGENVNISNYKGNQSFWFQISQ